MFCGFCWNPEKKLPRGWGSSTIFLSQGSGFRTFFGTRVGTSLIQKNSPGFCPGRGVGMVRLGIDWYIIITHLADQMYVWHSCKWNFARPQIYLQPAKIKSQHFGVSLKFLVCSWNYCIWRLTMCQNFSLQVCFYRTTSVRNIRISDCVHTVKTIVSYNASY